MTKRKAGTRKKKPQARPRRRRKSSALTRIWQQYSGKIGKVLLILVPAVVLIVAAYFLIGYFSSAGRADRAGKFLTQAREALLRSRYEDAQLAYHQALNANPDDQALKREQTMFRQRVALASGGSVKNAIAAAEAVLSYDSSSTVGHLLLAQLLNRQGELTGLYQHGLQALELARVEDDPCAGTAAAVLLNSYFRQRESFDSAYHYGNVSVDFAEQTEDTFDLLIAKSGLAYSALALDSLAQAESLARESMERAGAAYPGFVDLANNCLADYFRRTGQYDSSLSYANLTLARNPAYQPTPTVAHASQIAGRAHLGLKNSEAAEEYLKQAATAWRALAGYTDLITTYNVLGDLYRQSEDYFQARKYYLAATQLAEKYGLGHKGKYDINLNNFFLGRLESEAFLRSGEEAETLVNEVVAELGPAS
jgi:tetratricopeptide (TPR) repeat protein